jgi:hypothetical protein
LSGTAEQTRRASAQAQSGWLGALEHGLHRHWHLGRNMILSWSPAEGGIELLAVPHYLLVTFSATHATLTAEEAALAGDPALAGRPARDFVRSLITGSRRLSPERLRGIGRLLAARPFTIPLAGARLTDAASAQIDEMVSRFSISYVPNRAVALFDIVGFSLLDPFEQATQLNSLAYSVNSAHAKLMRNEIDVNFARSTTGDGFYIWNRDTGMHANANLYHFVHVVLADNAIARQKAHGNTTPLLRTAFHVGDHYEFYQAEGLNPTVYNYIVGEVTIELARIVEAAMPGQVLVGDFAFDAPGDEAKADSVAFINGLQDSLSKLRGMTLSGERIRDIKCYLTGAQRPGGDFAIHRYRITDKHGHSRNVFNAKINVYRSGGEPIFLGIQDRDLGGFERVESL